MEMFYMKNVTYTLITQEFVNSIQDQVKEAVKSATIQAIQLTEKTIIESKEGIEVAYPLDYLVVNNSDAAANYIIKENVFPTMYEKVEGNTYRKSVKTLVYKMNSAFSVIPSWNEGNALNSSHYGGYLMIYGENDFNVCSFEDFDRTYLFV
jgi:hypothetical protein